MNKKGVLIVISGFSGTGKGTVVKKLLEAHDRYVLSVSATTRAPREGELHGREYYFLTEAEFERMVQEEAFYEYAGYADHRYGTPRAFVDEHLENGKDVILEIEIQGAMRIKAQCPDCLLVFLIPPSAQALRERLEKRGTETEEVIQARLRRAVDEADGVEAYDYILVNDDLSECTDQLHRIIQDAHNRAGRRLEQVKRIRADLKEMLGTD